MGMRALTHTYDVYICTAATNIYQCVAQDQNIIMKILILSAIIILHNLICILLNYIKSAIYVCM